MGLDLVYEWEWLWEAFLRSEEENCKKWGSRGQAPQISREQNPKRKESQMQKPEVGSLWSVLGRAGGEGGHSRINHTQLFIVECMELVFSSYLFGFLQLAWSTFTRENSKNIRIWKKKIASYSLSDYSLRWVWSVFHFLKIHVHTF